MIQPFKVRAASGGIAVLAALIVSLAVPAQVGRTASTALRAGEGRVTAYERDEL